ncbi:hypothetical protein DFH06DRAFT_258869 [Mycena polygramma]|nr:hypothetical protein DFH06DRAFT_258869 [Mycena polygramma]
MLKALSGESASGDLAWDYGWEWIRYIASSTAPDPELLTVLRQINPIFLIAAQQADTRGFDTGRIIAWLEEYDPVPLDLINLWKEYIFMIYFFDHLESVEWDPSLSYLSGQRCEEVLSKSPWLLRIFYAASVLCPTGACAFLFEALGISFAEMRTAICSLRDIFDRDLPDRGTIWALARFVLLKYRPWLREHKIIAHRCVQLLKDIGSGVLYFEPWTWANPCWGILIRTSPAYLDLLHDIRDLVPPIRLLDFDPTCCNPIDVHNVLEWLKMYPQPPLDIIKRWEGYFLLAFHWMALSYGHIKLYYPKFKSEIEKQNKEFSFNDSFDGIPHLMRIKSAVDVLLARSCPPAEVLAHGL